MKLPRPITTSAIGALALSLGIVTLQAPAASAADRELNAPTSSTPEASPGEQITFTFTPPNSQHGHHGSAEYFSTGAWLRHDTDIERG